MFLKNIKQKLFRFFIKKSLTSIALSIILIILLFNYIYVKTYNYIYFEKNISRTTLNNSKDNTFKEIKTYLSNKNKIYFVYMKKSFVGSIIINNHKKIKEFNNLPIRTLNLYENYLLKNNIPYYWVSKNELEAKLFKNNISLKTKKISLYEKIDFLTFFLIFFLIYFLEKSGFISVGFLSNKFDLVFPNEIKGDMNDLIGLDDIKKNMNDIEKMILNNDNQSLNILFSGPAGTGKTKMAGYFAKQLNIPIIIGTGNVETGYVAGGSNNIKSLFKSAKTIGEFNKNKIIIFLDEAQVLLLKRNRKNSQSKWEDDTTNELLGNLDGINTKKDIQIIFIAASNFDDSNFELDEAIERRFQQKLYFPKPNFKERQKIIDFLIIKNNLQENNLDSEYLASITTGLSPSKLETIFKETILHSHGNNKTITTKYLVKQFEIITIGHTTKKINKEKESERELIITHELGHFFCYLEKLAIKYNYNKKDIIKNIQTLKISSEAIAKYNVLGYVINVEEDNKLKSIGDLENEIIQLYGGVAAEETFYSEKDITIGSFNDIEKITDIFDLLINKLNVYSKSKVNFNKLYSKSVLIQNNQDQIENKANELYKESLNIVKKHKNNIIIIKKIMIEKWVLHKNDIVELIEQNIIKIESN